MVSSVSRTYGAYQQINFKPSQRMTRAEEKRDYVTLSTQAKDFSAVRKALSKTPDIRADKVNDIRSRMQADEYSVSTSDIADKMVAKYFK